MDVTEVTETTQFLTFTLGEETYALEINKVSEVLDVTKLTKIPHTPDYFLGVINLRGNVLPVVDMRLKLNIPPYTKTENASIVIVEGESYGENSKIGVVTDTVEDVIGLGKEQILLPPKLGLKLNPKFIRGMAKQNGDEEKFIIIVDIDRILNAEEVDELQKEIDEIKKTPESQVQEQEEQVA